MTEETRSEQVAKFYDGPAEASLLIAETKHLHVGLFESPEESLATAQERLVMEMMRPLALSPGDHLLDMGCGVGLPAIRIARQHGCRVTGITLSEAQVEHARALITEARLSEQIQVMKMDAHQMTFAEATFSAAMALESMVHMNRPRAASALARVLAPGAPFVLCDWYTRVPLTEKEAAYIRAAIYMETVPLDAYVALLEEAGFTDIVVTDWTAAIEPTYQRWSQPRSPEAGQPLPAEFLRRAQEISRNMTRIATTKLGYVRIAARRRS